MCFVCGYFLSRRTNMAGPEQRERDLREALRGMLISQDASWEQDNLGHDWKQACEVARAALHPTEPRKDKL